MMSFHPLPDSMPTQNPSHPHSDASRTLSGCGEMGASDDTPPRASLRSALGYVLSAPWAGLAIHVAWVKWLQWEILATSRAHSGRGEMWASHGTPPRASLRSALGYVLSAPWAGLAIHVAWVKWLQWEILATSRAHSGCGEMWASHGTPPRASLRSALGYVLPPRWAGLAYRPQPGTKLTPLHPGASLRSALGYVLSALWAALLRPQRGPRFQPRAEGALATDALGHERPPRFHFIAP
jgi:hypothetical protein